jgi:hypothetical protein
MTSRSQIFNKPQQLGQQQPGGMGNMPSFLTDARKQQNQMVSQMTPEQQMAYRTRNGIQTGMQGNQKGPMNMPNPAGMQGGPTGGGSQVGGMNLGGGIVPPKPNPSMVTPQARQVSPREQQLINQAAARPTPQAVGQFASPGATTPQQLAQAQALEQRGINPNKMNWAQMAEQGWM